MLCRILNLFAATLRHHWPWLLTLSYVVHYVNNHVIFSLAWLKCSLFNAKQSPVIYQVPSVIVDMFNTDRQNDYVCLCQCSLTFYQLLQLVTNPMSRWRLRPTRQGLPPTPTDRWQERICSMSRDPRLANHVSTAVIIIIHKISGIQHQESSH